VIELSEQQIIDQIAERLSGAYTTVSPDTVSRLVHGEYARFNGPPIRDFVPLFVERCAKAELAKFDGRLAASTA
jgi:hypothetical protein